MTQGSLAVIEAVSTDVMNEAAKHGKLWVMCDWKIREAREDEAYLRKLREGD